MFYQACDRVWVTESYILNNEDVREHLCGGEDVFLSPESDSGKIYYNAIGKETKFRPFVWLFYHL